MLWNLIINLGLVLKRIQCPLGRDLMLSAQLAVLTSRRQVHSIYARKLRVLSAIYHLKGAGLVCQSPSERCRLCLPVTVWQVRILSTGHRLKRADLVCQSASELCRSCLPVTVWKVRVLSASHRLKDAGHVCQSPYERYRFCLPVTVWKVWVLSASHRLNSASLVWVMRSHRLKCASLFWVELESPSERWKFFSASRWNCRPTCTNLFYKLSSCITSQC